MFWLLHWLRASFVAWKQRRRKKNSKSANTHTNTNTHRVHWNPKQLKSSSLDQTLSWTQQITKRLTSKLAPLQKWSHFVRHVVVKLNHWSNITVKFLQSSHSASSDKWQDCLILWSLLACQVFLTVEKAASLFAPLPVFLFSF